MTTAISPIECLRAKPMVSATWIGTLLWAGLIALLPLPLTTMTVLLAALVIVPIVLDHIALASRQTSRLLHVVGWIQIPAALLLALGYVTPAGPIAAALCAAWTMVTVLLAVHGLVRLVGRGSEWWKPADLGIDVALMLSSIGGIWALLFRFGAWPGGYPPIVAELTAVHFHYAGLVLPIVVGRAAAYTGAVWARGMVPGICGAVLLLAIGITFSSQLEWFAAIVLILIAIVTALVQLRAAVKATRPLALVLLATSALALLTGMTLAVTYATGEMMAPAWGLAEYRGGGWISIPQMIQLHGSVLAFGFAIPALVGWNAN